MINSERKIFFIAIVFKISELLISIYKNNRNRKTPHQVYDNIIKLNFLRYFYSIKKIKSAEIIMKSADYGHSR